MPHDNHQHGRHPTSRRVRALLLVAVVILAWSGSIVLAQRATPEPRNFAQLVSDAQTIVVAKVIRVTDGVNAQGTPYTEVMLDVAECAKGGLVEGGRTSFRQYGLVAPRKLANGAMLREVSPADYPRWQEGEQVVAFLLAPARRTGLQTTVGLQQGKFSLLDGRVVNGIDNRGLFAGVRVADGLLDARERAMFGSRGPVDATTFIRLVERAVDGDWIARGQLR